MLFLNVVGLAVVCRVFRLSRGDSELSRFSPGPHGACIPEGETGVRQVNQCSTRPRPPDCGPSCPINYCLFFKDT